MITVMLCNKIINPSELFIRGRKLNIYLVFITEACFSVPKYMRINSAHNFIIRFPNKRELQQVALNHSPDIEFWEVLQ